MTQEALKLALEKIATVNAMDYEYQAWAREALAKTQEPKRTGMVYYKNDACQAKDAYSHDCICWTKAQPEQNPVAWMFEFPDKRLAPKFDSAPHGGNWKPLYTTPPQRKPLTDEELRVIENKINPNMRWRSSDEEGITLYPIEYYELVRAIEAAHGIKE